MTGEKNSPSTSAHHEFEFQWNWCQNTLRCIFIQWVKFLMSFFLRLLNERQRKKQFEWHEHHDWWQITNNGRYECRARKKKKSLHCDRWSIWKKLIETSSKQSTKNIRCVNRIQPRNKRVTIDLIIPIRTKKKQKHEMKKKIIDMYGVEGRRNTVERLVEIITETSTTR